MDEPITLIQSDDTDMPVLVAGRRKHFEQAIRQWLREAYERESSTSPLDQFEEWLEESGYPVVQYQRYYLPTYLAEVCRLCGDLNDGDGYDGLCGNCADRVYGSDL